MAPRSFASHGVACLLAVGSIALAFFLLADLGFMVSYFASGADRSGWWGPAWRRFLHDVIQPGPLALLGGWAILTAGMALPGSLLARPDRKTKTGFSLASVASLLSNCGLMGAGVAVAILASLAGCRSIWFR